ncbi:MAG: uracil-DNA glycosylase family protein [Acidaminococcaceae bacterium]
MNVKMVLYEAEKIREQLLKDNRVSNFIDKENERIPEPYLGGKEIKLIIIGQDPTVRNENSRKNITTVLNLNKENSALFKYINEISTSLNCEIKENVYATNLLKCFFTVPPASIKNFVSEQTGYWLPLLREEIAAYPNAKIITLGEPVFQTLVSSGFKKVNKYWAYCGNTTAIVNNFSYCKDEDNKLNRTIFPFPHQPTWKRNKFYGNYFSGYAQYAARQ